MAKIVWDLTSPVLVTERSNKWTSQEFINSGMVEEIDGTDALFFGAGLRGTDVHGHVSLELYDKDGTRVGTAINWQGGTSAGIGLYPAATDGDRGSNRGSLNWDVDPTQFSTGKVVITCSGVSMNSSFFEVTGNDSEDTQLEYQAKSFNSMSQVTYEFQFTVVA